MVPVLTSVSLLFFSCTLCAGQSVQGNEYIVEAFKQEGEDEVLILKLKPASNSPSSQFHILQEAFARQEEDEDEDEGPVTTPFIPTIIPGLTKIFNGIVTGNLNEIFHGSTSFAPKNVSYAIDTVYNQVVGIPPPVTTVPTTPTTPRALNVTVAGLAANATVAVTEAVGGDDDDEEGNERSFRIRRNSKFLNV